MGKPPRHLDKRKTRIGKVNFRNELDRVPGYVQNFPPPNKIADVVQREVLSRNLASAGGKKIENILKQLMNNLPRLILGAQNSGTQQISIPLKVVRQSEPRKKFILVLTVKGDGAIEFHEHQPK